MSKNTNNIPEILADLMVEEGIKSPSEFADKTKRAKLDERMAEGLDINSTSNPKGPNFDRAKYHQDIEGFISGKKKLRVDAHAHGKAHVLDGSKSKYFIIKTSPKTKRPEYFLTDEGRGWLMNNVRRVASMNDPTRFDVVTVIDNECIHWISPRMTLVSDSFEQFIRETDPQWSGCPHGIMRSFITNVYHTLRIFNRMEVIRDTADEMFFQYRDGLVTLSKKGMKFEKGKPRLVWRRNIIPRKAPRNLTAWRRKKLFKVLTTKIIAPHHQKDRLYLILGFMLHRYNNGKSPMAAYYHDWQPKSAQDGRRGKDFTGYEFISVMRNTVTCRYDENDQFMFESVVSYETEAVHFKDVTPGWGNRMKDMVDGNLEVNKKNIASVMLSREDAPKISASGQGMLYDMHDASICQRYPTLAFTDYLQKNQLDSEYFKFIRDVDTEEPGWWSRSGVRKEAPEGMDSFMLYCGQQWLRNEGKYIAPKMLEEDRMEYFKKHYGKYMDAMKALIEEKELPLERIAGLLNVSPNASKQIGDFKKIFAVLNPDKAVVASSESDYDIVEGKKVYRTITKLRVAGKEELEKTAEVVFGVKNG